MFKKKQMFSNSIKIVEENLLDVLNEAEEENNFMVDKENQNLNVIQAKFVTKRKRSALGSRSNLTPEVPVEQISKSVNKSSITIMRVPREKKVDEKNSNLNIVDSTVEPIELIEPVDSEYIIENEKVFDLFKTQADSDEIDDSNDEDYKAKKSKSVFKPKQKKATTKKKPASKPKTKTSKAKPVKLDRATEEELESWANEMNEICNYKLIFEYANHD